MTGSRAPIPADPTDHPLRTALAQGDALRARSGPALHHILAAQDRSLLSEAVIAQVGGMLADLAEQLVAARAAAVDPVAAREAVTAQLLLVDALREHCQALALEWRLAVRLEAELALDPVLSPLLQAQVADADPGVGALAMAALAAQARFAQAQRRMQLPLGELPADLFHAALLAAREAVNAAGQDDAARAEARLRAGYEEGAARLALFARLVASSPSIPTPMPTLEDAGVALWLSALAERSGEERDHTACAVADPLLGRLLLTLRAAGVAPAEAERQALRTQPNAELPHGLQDIGTREAAQWLAEAQA
jgi:hypothetical protein